jgi:hypothetical protein
MVRTFAPYLKTIHDKNRDATINFGNLPGTTEPHVGHFRHPHDFHNFEVSSFLTGFMRTGNAVPRALVATGGHEWDKHDARTAHDNALHTRRPAFMRNITNEYRVDQILHGRGVPAYDPNMYGHHQVYKMQPRGGVSVSS